MEANPASGSATEADDEARLIAAAQAAVAAFDALYDRYLDRVFAYVRAHAQSTEEAADLTQQVFLKALEALPAYRPQGVPFAIWLFRIARHLLIDAFRRRRPTVEWESVPDTLQPASEESLESLAICHEETARLRAAIASLPERQRELLALRYAAGLDAPEIAAVLGKSPAAIRKQLSRTISALKELYHVS